MLTNGFQLTNIPKIWVSLQTLSAMLFSFLLKPPMHLDTLTPLTPLHACKQKVPKHQLAAKYMQESIYKIKVQIKK